MLLKTDLKTLFELNDCDINSRDILNISLETEEYASTVIALVTYTDIVIEASLYVAFYPDGHFKSQTNEKMIFSNEREAVRTVIKRFKNKGKNIESLFDYFKSYRL